MVKFLLSLNIRKELMMDKLEGILNHVLNWEQLKMHSFVNKILRREMHLPSAEKEWQMPAAIEFPIPFLLPLRFTPEEVQATSYLAASVKMASFSIRDIFC